MKFLHKIISIFISSLFLLLALVGCRESEFTPDYPVQPAGYLKLIDAYESGAKYTGIKFTSTETTVQFDTGDIVIPSNGVLIFNCITTAPVRVGLSEDGSVWTLDWIRGTIKNQPHITRRQATVVYAYVNRETLFMHLSNGEIIEFPSLVPPPSEEGPQVFTMPIVRITHKSDRVHYSYYIDGTISITDPDKHYSSDDPIDCKVQIKGRGNSTWDKPKKPYRIKLEEKNKVLGMHSNKDWVLLANYSDKSLMRNRTAMHISRILGFDWTPHCVPVELYINNSYLGVYDLFEHKEVAKHKVDIDVEAGDVYLEIEQTIDEPHYFYTGMGVPIQFKDPESPAPEKEAFIKTYFSNFENVLKSTYFDDPKRGYPAYIDVDSFVDNYIIEELSKDVDGNLRKSSFLTMENGGKLKFYHVWDFDLAFGNADYFPGKNNGPTGWWIKDYNTNSTKGDGWYQRLFKDRAFVSKVKNRWNEVYPQLCTIPDFIDLEVAEMQDAPARNFRTWNILGIYVWPNVKITGSYEKEVQWLKDFYTQRLEWLNTNINNL